MFLFPLAEFSSHHIFSSFVFLFVNIKAKTKLFSLFDVVLKIPHQESVTHYSLKGGFPFLIFEE